VAFLVLVNTAATATSLAIDFESLDDSEVLTTQIGGLAFANATALSAGVSLNEFEFPPRSGTNVVFDDGGGIDIVFESLQGFVGGYFTYLVPITLTAFDSSDNILGATSSSFPSNLALSGDAGSSANEFLSLSFAGISRVLIAGDLSGSSFVLDDLTLRAPTEVPEPSTISILLPLLSSWWLCTRRRSAGKRKSGATP
jgi:hypothetical protein